MHARVRARLTPGGNPPCKHTHTPAQTLDAPRRAGPGLFVPGLAQPRASGQLSLLGLRRDGVWGMNSPTASVHVDARWT